MPAVLAYQFEEEPVRVATLLGDPWFVAADIARALGYRDAPAMTRNLHDDEKGTHIVCTPSGQQEMNIISESGMYAAIFKSRRDEAERFRKWVTSVVLPSIRRPDGGDAGGGPAEAVRLGSVGGQARRGEGQPVLPPRPCPGERHRSYGGAVVSMDLDTEDVVVHHRLAMACVVELLEGQDRISMVKPHNLAVLLSIVMEHHERALPCGGRPPRAVNDLDTD